MIDERSMNYPDLPSQTPKVILCLMTDRFPLALLGAYGNEFAETCAFDRLASESAVFDQYYATSPDLGSLYHALWTGNDSANNRDAEEQSLAARFRNRGYRTILLTDASEISLLPEADGFDRIEMVPPTNNSLADDLESTRFFSFFAQIADLIAESADHSPVFLWAHLTALGGVWDFPLEMRRLFVEDEEDPDPYPDTAVPFFTLATLSKKAGKTSNASAEEEPDFDRLQAVLESAAAGMAIWDRSLEFLQNALQAGGVWKDTALVLGGTRGFPLGEHSRVGVSDAETSANNSLEYSGGFYSEEIHQPLLIHLPNGLGTAVRVLGLATPADLGQTLSHLAESVLVPDETSAAMESPVAESSGRGRDLLPLLSEEAESVRDSLILTERDSTGQLLRRGILTPEWFLLRTVETGAENPPAFDVELYVHPDDRWEINEVSRRCENEVRDLLRQLGNQS